MNSPAVFPFKSTIKLNRNSHRPIYLQLCDQIIGFIKSGTLSPSTKLPGSRKLSEDLQVHRKTVVAAYEELMSQGWIKSFPSKGTYVCHDLPIITPKHFNKVTSKKITNKAGFEFRSLPHLIKDTRKTCKTTFMIDDGIPDHRLAPIDDIARIYRNISKKTYHQHLLTYGDVYGNMELRKALVQYLNQTRGLKITIDNVLITRGSQMGIYLASQLLLDKGKIIIVGTTNYITADNTFIQAKGSIERVSIDECGINTTEIEKLCQKQKITAVYVTSHHHHPTTVTLSAERRMHLLELAHTYSFAIIEDDYDYDFHYSNAPILPLASNDYNRNVIYIGGFTKIVAPALRIGYFIASKDVVAEAAALRRIIDRQGDTILEQTLARMLFNGDIQRHSNKVLKIYKNRRDLFCRLFKEKLGNHFDFEIPKGGMAVWIRLHKKYNWNVIEQEAIKQHLTFTTEWKYYDKNNTGHNGIRIGFASLNEDEIRILIDRLVKIMNLF